MRLGRIVVDDHNVVSEAEVENYVPGSVAKARGYNVPDESGHYLVRRNGPQRFAHVPPPSAQIVVPLR